MTSIRALLFVLAATAVVGLSASACNTGAHTEGFTSTFDPPPGDDSGVGVDGSAPPVVTPD